MGEEIKPKKKIVYEDRPVNLEPLEADAVLPEPPIQAPKEEYEDVVEYKQSMIPNDIKRMALVGAAPLLMGIMTGNAGDGAAVASDNIIADEKHQREIAAKNSKNSLENRLAQLRLERELAKTATEKEKQRTKTAGGLEDKHMVEVEDENGNPIVMTNDEAFRLKAKLYKKDTKSDFHLEEKKELEKFKASLEKSKPLDPYKAAKSENELYRLYQKDSGTTMKMGEAYSRFKGTMSRPKSGANDVAVIFNYMKVLDPSSTVREGEQATAANAGSVPDSILLQYNRLLLGKDQKLPEGLRERMFNEATAMYNEQLNAQKEIDTFYKSVSGRRGINSANIVRSFPQAKEVSEGGAIPGTVTYKNSKGDTLVIDPKKLSPRGKKELEQDGFSLEGSK